jgi:hypothetical protein
MSLELLDIFFSKNHPTLLKKLQEAYAKAKAAAMHHGLYFKNCVQKLLGIFSLLNQYNSNTNTKHFSQTPCCSVLDF